MIAGSKIRWTLLIFLLNCTLILGGPSDQRVVAFFNSQPMARNASTETPLRESSSLQESTPRSTKSDIDPRRAISISKSIEVPFSATAAYDAFGDLPRQAEFSPWLRKVEYLNPPPLGAERAGKHWGETKWYMGFRGLSFSWNAICTTLERPGCIEWESTSGMKNFGKVIFEEQEDQTNVTLTMTFVAPRVVASLFKRSNSLANFVQNRMIFTTLKNFRDIVTKEEAGKTTETC